MNYLLDSFEKIDENGDGVLSRREIKQTLQLLCEKEKPNNTADGLFARKYIDTIYSTYESTRERVDNADLPDKVKNPLEEMGLIFDEFFTNEQMNND